jgi:hypothetical protein
VRAGSSARAPRKFRLPSRIGGFRLGRKYSRCGCRLHAGRGDIMQAIPPASRPGARDGYGRSALRPDIGSFPRPGHRRSDAENHSGQFGSRRPRRRMVEDGLCRADVDGCLRSRIDHRLQHVGLGVILPDGKKAKFPTTPHIIPKCAGIRRCQSQNARSLSYPL